MFPKLQNDLILRAARGESVEKIPVWVMRQAGRYDPGDFYLIFLKEAFRKVREQYDFFTICRTPQLAAEVTLQPIDRYNDLLDAAIIFSDILVVPQALGLTVEMHDGKGGPFFPEPLKDPEDMHRLKSVVDVNKELGYVFEAITLTRMKLDGRVPLFGFAGSPWTLMAYMTEGGGSRTFSKSKSWLFKNPEDSHKLLQRITDVVVDFLAGQVKAGAQILQVFDSWAGELSPKHFREFSLPYISQIAEKVKRKLSDQGLEPVPMVIFAKGAHDSLDLLSQIGYDIVSLDWTIDPAKARDSTKGRVTLQGNMDPGCLYGTPDFIRGEVKELFSKFGTKGWIANLGHGMQPGKFLMSCFTQDHNPESLRVFLEAIRDFSQLTP